MYIFLLDFISFSCIFLYLFAGLFFKNLNMRNMTEVFKGPLWIWIGGLFGLAGVVLIYF